MPETNGTSPFDFVSARGPVVAATGSVAWVRALLDAEVALAWALADTELASPDAAVQVEAASDVDAFDVDGLFAAAAAGGNPVIPLVAELAARLDGDAAAALHRGATSQDIFDTATALVVRRATAPLLDDVAAAAEHCAQLARLHQTTPMVGRTLLQHAAPTSFGLMAATWMTNLDEAASDLVAAATGLPAQLGGATGTLAAYGERAGDVTAAYARRLDLPAPTIPWHAQRIPIVRLAAGLGAVSASAESIASDIVLLAQTEIAELIEDAALADTSSHATPGRRPAGAVGGSSAMPHKRNPIAAVSARAAAKQAPGLVANIFAAAGDHELQRAAGAWHAEWPSLHALLRAAGSSVSWLVESLRRLRVDAERMRSNLDLTSGLLSSSALTDRLTEQVGRAPARALVNAAIERASHQGTSFVDEAAGDHDIIDAIGSRNEVLAVLDPIAGVATAAALVDRALGQRPTGYRPSATAATPSTAGMTTTDRGDR